jgi:hypothetical protein
MGEAMESVTDNLYHRIGKIGQGHLTLTSGRMITSSGIGPVIIIVVFIIE